MKKYILIILSLTPFLIFAQKANEVSLKKGQVITANYTLSMDADMGMGLVMKNATSSSSQIVVLEESGPQYLLSSTLKKINVAIEAMGQQQTYNSEKQTEPESELSKALSGNLNKPDSFRMDRINGTVIAINSSPEKKEIGASANPLDGIMDMMGETNVDQALSNAFFLIPAGKKVGDSWIDSAVTPKNRTVKTFTLQSIDKKTAKVQMIGIIQVDTDQDIQGNTVHIIMNSALKEEINLDPKTGLVSTRLLTTDVTGQIDMMGQSINTSSKIKTSYDYSY
jgi:hypothetical protein